MPADAYSWPARPAVKLQSTCKRLNDSYTTILTPKKVVITAHHTRCTICVPFRHVHGHLVHRYASHS